MPEHVENLILEIRLRQSDKTHKEELWTVTKFNES